MEKNTKRELYSWMKSIGFALIIALICRHFLFSPSIVHGESMLPTFQNDDRILLSKTSDIQRFDIIVFDAPDSDEYYIKRVIGLPGDSIEMRNDVLYINGKAYQEPYLQEMREGIPTAKLTGDFTLMEVTGESRVPKDSLFVLGDNRLNSKDSRFFGFVPYASVVGEAKFRFYPFQEIGIPH